MTVADGGDRAVVDARRDGLDLGLLEPLDHLVGLEAGREVDVADRQVEEVVADRAADIARHALVGVERVEQPRHAAAACATWRRSSLSVHWSLRDRLTIIAAVAPQILRPFHTIS